MYLWWRMEHVRRHSTRNIFVGLVVGLITSIVPQKFFLFHRNIRGDTTLEVYAITHFYISTFFLSVCHTKVNPDSYVFGCVSLFVYLQIHRYTYIPFRLFFLLFLGTVDCRHLWRSFL